MRKRTTTASRKPSPKRLAAVREAAHALVAHLHGLRVSELRLEVDEDGHDLLDGLRLSLDASVLRHHPEAHFITILKKAEVALAGEVAATLLHGHAGSGPGDAVALAIAERLGPTPRQREALLDLARARLHDLLSSEPARSSLEALAERLEREAVLDRDAVNLVVLRGVKLPDE